MNVCQVLSGAGPVDAVTSQALAFRRRFDEWGWAGEDVVAAMDPRVSGSFRLLEGWSPPPDAILLIHYSAYAPRLRPLLELPNRKLLMSHNVTPAKWLWDYEPVVAIHCEVGRAQLPEFAAAVDLAVGVSEYNSAELRAAGARAVTTVPILFEPPPARGPAAPAEPPEVLFVGRLSPHKRHDEALRAFALYRGAHAPEATLRFVGTPVGPGYRGRLEELGERLVPGALTIEAGLSADDLWARYRRASAFLCLSEHEGFCIPLLEAFHFGVPVIARPVGGIPEVAGDAALLTDDRDPAVVAELLDLAISDAELRAELDRRAAGRLAAYEPEKTAARLRSALDSLAA